MSLDIKFSDHIKDQINYKRYKDTRMDGAMSHSGLRTFITMLAEKGVGVREWMTQSEYKRVAIVQHYIELNPSVMNAAVELI